MGKVLSFPKEKTKRVHLLQKLEARRLFYSFSVFSVIVMAIVIGEKLNSMSRPRYVFAVNYDQNAKLNRAVASQENVEFVEDIRWGQKIVQHLNESGIDTNREPAAIGTSPDQYDQLRYGELAGKYRLTGTQGQKISEIEFVESEQVSETPIHLRNREKFLTEHRELLAIPFASARNTRGLPYWLGTRRCRTRSFARDVWSRRRPVHGSQGCLRTWRCLRPSILRFFCSYLHTYHRAVSSVCVFFGFPTVFGNRCRLTTRP